MSGGPLLPRKRANQVVSGLAGTSALFVALLAIATNFATSAVPDEVKRWTNDWRWTWGATIVLLAVCVAVPIAERRRSAIEGASPMTNLPARNASFVGRGRDLRRMRRALSSGPVAVTALRGLGGVGKSQLALEFAHRAYAKGRYRVVWWIRSDARVTLLEDMVALGAVMGADGEGEASDVLTALAGRGDWLLIFDNARSADEVRPWLPAGAGHTIITSRNRGWSGLAKQVELVRFNRRDSLRYLRLRVSRYDPTAADELSETLGDLPLALAQAASYLEIYDLTILAFLEVYRDRDSAGRLLAGHIDGYPLSVATTWLLHHDQLRRESPATLEVLRLCSFLDSDDIDLGLVLSDTKIPTRPDAVPVEGPLVDASLMDRLTGRHVRIHRLVAEATRLQLEPDGARDWADSVITLLDRLFPDDPRDRMTWERCAALSGHISAAVDHATYYSVPGERLVPLVTRQTLFLEASRSADVAAADRVVASWIRTRAARLSESLIGRYERRYLRYMTALFQYIDVRGFATVGPSTPELAEIYVTPGVTDCASNAHPIEHYLSDDQRVVVVVGPPGSGKSTLLNRLAAEAARSRRPHRSIPIVLRLRDIANWRAAASLPELVGLTTPNLRLAEPAGWWHQQLAAGRCLVLLDGLDEVLDFDQRAAVVDWLESTITAYPANRFVVTSRAVGYHDMPLERARVVQLQPFTPDQARTMIYSWYAAAERYATGVDGAEIRRRATEGASDLWNRLTATPALQSFTSSPLLLTMIANVHRYRAALPSGTADLYGEIVDVMLWRRAESTVRAVWRTPVLAQLAFTMMVSGKQGVSRVEALSIIGDVPELPPGITADQLLDDVEATSGLIVESEHGFYAFAHLTFEEYLAARHVRDKGLIAILTGSVDDPSWRQTIIFYAQIGDADAIVRACLDSCSEYAIDLAHECVENGAAIDQALLARLI